MPIENEVNTQNSEEVQEIITDVPSWILRWGIVLIFSILLGIIGLSALIQYPDVVKVSLKVSAGVAPKVVVAKQGGKIEALLAKEDENVNAGEPLAFLESTAKHYDVIRLREELHDYRETLGKNGLYKLDLPESGLALGELQPEYQNFYLQYLKYQSTLNSGYYQRKMSFLKFDIKTINEQKWQIERQHKIQQQAYKKIKTEYEDYKKLYNKKVIPLNEFRQQENKYFDSKFPLQQLKASLITNTIAYAAKEKELFDLKHIINEDRSNFLQSLNSLIAATEAWLLKFVPSAPITGKLSYAGVLQVNQNIEAGQQLFVVNSGNNYFFGDINIPQRSMGKIRQGQKVLVKLYSYPYEQFGMIRGKIAFISDAAYRDSVFTAKVKFEEFENKDPRFKIRLKNGMLADAEIIMEDNTLLQRFTRNLTAMLQ